MLARLLLKFDQESFLNQLSSAGVRGTIGYAAPGERLLCQGARRTKATVLPPWTSKARLCSIRRSPRCRIWNGGQPSIHGDVYSFGILLLEMFTGKRPTNEIFEGNITLHSYIKSVLPERVMHAADEPVGLRVGFPIAECLTLGFQSGT
uniref:Protein kinase domain-containing protein n=1 Tax=Brassica oleracea var. oleracea TaxID=109376 RepID=A0A0D3BHU7_BRAOL